MVATGQLHAVALLALVSGACVQSGIEHEVALAPLDGDYFRCVVEPVLIKRCAFAACHGSDARPFRLYAPHRLRRAGDAASPLTDQEHRANYERSLGFVGGDGAPPLLLRKALDVQAGGYYHRGDELYGGGDVFASTEAAGYRAIEAWTLGDARAQSGCEPAPEVGP